MAADLIAADEYQARMSRLQESVANIGWGSIVGSLSSMLLADVKKEREHE